MMYLVLFDISKRYIKMYLEKVFEVRCRGSTCLWWRLKIVCDVGRWTEMDFRFVQNVQNRLDVQVAFDVSQTATMLGIIDFDIYENSS